MTAKKEKKKKSSKIKIICIVLLFLVGFGIFIYPTVSDLWNKYRNQKLIASYTQSVEDMTAERLEAIWEQAKGYNDQHQTNTIVDAFNEDDDYVLSHPYDTLLDPNGNGLMGSIEIPKLNLKLAIYHGLGTEALENGVGHVEGTSLPIGGEGTHAVLAGHRGLPSARLFTDLDQMQIGDTFLIHVLDQTLAYKVDQIKTVLPEETEDLAIVPGEDHVTLITCTPYGVNTHRLLVRGVRTEYTEEIQEEVEAEIVPVFQPVYITIAGGAVFVVVLLIVSAIMKKKKRKEEEKED